MARPDTTDFQEQLYDAIGPLTYGDSDDNDWALLIYVGAHASMFDQMEEYIRYDDDGTPGWGRLMDIDRTPVEVIPWLAQFKGVQNVPTNLTEQGQRDYVKSTDGFKRGTTDAIIGAAQQTLTGTKTVIVRERDPSVDTTVGGEGAYGMTVLTYTSETPDSAVVLANILKQKAGGLLLAYSTVTGAIYLLIRTTYATYNDIKTGASSFLTYTGLRNNVPGT